MSPFRRFLAAAATTALTVGAAAMFAGPVSAQPQLVRPKQYFAGEVNGNSRQSVLSVEGCPSPTVTTDPPPAQSPDGHPLPGQSVSVMQFVVPPPTPVNDPVGYTGRAHKISADLVVSLDEPPLSYLVPITTITDYNVSALIPTSLSLPCNATYSVMFMPYNGGAKAVTSNVALTLGIPRIAIGPTPVAAAPVVNLEGSGFVPNSNYTVAECPVTNWVAPQSPCVNTNNVAVATDASGAFSHPFAPVPCTVILPSTCYIGVPLPSGIDTIALVGATKIIVP